MNAQIDKEAGLYTQIRTLKKRIDSLDMTKVDPSELKAAIDSLKDLETRYADMQEKKKQRALEKQNKEKELASQTVTSEVAPEAIPVEAAPESIPVAAAPEGEPAPQPVPEIDTKPEEMEPKKAEEKVEDKPVEEKKPTQESKGPEFESTQGNMLYMKLLDYLIFADDPQHDTIMKFRRAIERLQNEKDRETLKEVFNKEFQGVQKTPWDYYAEAEKTSSEIKPQETEKKADTSKFALDDIVEPVYGSAGSYGRIMRYDADKDMAYVHWDGGKLQADHGFGAYKGSDLRKRAGQVCPRCKKESPTKLYMGVCDQCNTDMAERDFGHKDASLKKDAVLVFDVFLGDKEIDTLFYNESANPKENPSEDDVRRSLINHDNYDPGIRVVQRNQDKMFPPKPLPKSRRPEDVEHFPLLEDTRNPQASLKLVARVVNREDGWHVLSEEGKNLGGPYKSKEQAVKRLRQVEYFKHHKGSFKGSIKKAFQDDAMMEKLWEELANVPFDEDPENHNELVLGIDWNGFPKGTEREEIWHWFDENYSKGLAALMGLTDDVRSNAGMSDPTGDVDPNENPGEGYGGDRPGIAVAPKASLKEAAKVNVANRMWEIVPRYDMSSGQTKLLGYEIISDTGERAGFIKTTQPLNQAVIEQEIWNQVGKSGSLYATLNTNLSVLKKGHKVKIVSVDVKRKEAKFASVEMKSITGWTSLDRFDFVTEAKKDDHSIDALMPMSKSNVVRIKSAAVLTELAQKCPDCYKKFLKFAKEKGLHIQADDLDTHIEQMRTKITQTKEQLQNQSQASVAPESVETEAALPPKPNIQLPQGMKWLYMMETNTWEMVADDKFTY